MTTEINEQFEATQESEIIRNLYLALFTKNALRNVPMSLASSYMDADISGNSIRWEDTTACPLLKVLTELQHLGSEHVVNDPTTLLTFSEFVQLKTSEFVENAGTPGGLKAKWLPEILSKCREAATKACLPFVAGARMDSKAFYGFCGLEELVADAYKSRKVSELISLQVHFTIGQAFTIRAIELFTIRMKEMHNSSKPTGFSFFESFKEFAPLIYVATSIYEFVADKDITSIDALERFIAQIQQQFSATEELSNAAREKCNQMLEFCLSNSLTAGRLALERHLVTA